MENMIGQSLGRYTILEQLGEGGMAVVYKAYDTRLERNVAIKIIRKGAFPAEQLDKIMKRFEREAKALAQLSHPNIVKVHDYGEFESSPYLVMEYLPGGTLKAKMGQPFPPGLSARTGWHEAAKILIPIGHALDYAHQHGILHRDVKPSNILMTETSEPMLTDFGIAKILDIEETHTLTGTGVGIGTPEYMAPEQGIGKEVDARADVYSLGVVFYELVTGRKPYMADTPMAVILKQVNDPLPPPRRFIPNIPDQVENILLKALAKQPENRYADMRAFTSALESLGSMPVMVPSISSSGEKTQVAFGETGVRTGQPLVSQDQTAKQVKSPPPYPKKKKAWWFWAFGAGGLVLVACVALAAVVMPKIISMLVEHPTDTPTAGQTIPAMSTSAETKTIQTSPTPKLGIGSTWVRGSDGMVMLYVPEGDFNMGGSSDQAMNSCRNYFNDCQATWFSDETPSHTVSLPAYWIDRVEISNAFYAKCVSAGACPTPNTVSSHTRSSYYGNPQFADFPVINVDWKRAAIYCAWAGGKLPTEAEWEKAARGTDGRAYPWGNSLPTCTMAFFGELIFCTNDTGLVESLPSGASPYGLLNMAGNVSEWVNDWYGEAYYGQSMQTNPAGPESGQERVVRGGAWSLNPNFIRTTNRDHLSPNQSKDYIGFRCVMDYNP